MSWVIKQGKNGNYGWWTTTADGWMTTPKFLPRDKMIEAIIAKKTIKFNQEIEELRKTFPKGWFDKDTRRIIN
jgi:hypothetical protein